MKINQKDMLGFFAAQERAMQAIRDGEKDMSNYYAELQQYGISNPQLFVIQLNEVIHVIF